MKTRSIDIETYSSAPLQKSGVYRYVEAEDFEILLFGYSVDSGPVQVSTLPTENISQRKSCRHWRMKKSSNGPSTPPLNATACLATWAILPAIT